MQNAVDISYVVLSKANKSPHVNNGFLGRLRPKGNIEFAGSLLAWRAKTNILSISINNYKSFIFGGPDGYQKAFDAYAAPAKAIKNAASLASKYSGPAKRIAADMAKLFSPAYLRAVANEDK